MATATEFPTEMTLFGFFWSFLTPTQRMAVYAEVTATPEYREVLKLDGEREAAKVRLMIARPYEADGLARDYADLVVRHSLYVAEKFRPIVEAAVAKAKEA